MKHKRILIKSAKARVTGTIPYCHGKVPHSKFHEILFSSFRGVVLTSCFSSKFRDFSKFKGA